MTCLECVLVVKRSSHLGIPAADQIVCGQSAKKILQQSISGFIRCCKFHLILSFPNEEATSARVKVTPVLQLFETRI